MNDEAIQGNRVPDTDWTKVPVIQDGPAMPPPPGAPGGGPGDPKASMPKGREPTSYEAEQLHQMDTEMQRIHHQKRDVAKLMYESVVAKNEAAAADYLARWKTLCDEELTQAMKAMTLQAFSQRMIREEREERFAGASHAAMTAAGRAPEDLKPIVSRGK